MVDSAGGASAPATAPAGAAGAAQGLGGEEVAELRKLVADLEQQNNKLQARGRPRCSLLPGCCGGPHPGLAGGRQGWLVLTHLGCLQAHNCGVQVAASWARCTCCETGLARPPSPTPGHATAPATHPSHPPSQLCPVACVF